MRVDVEKFNARASLCECVMCILCIDLVVRSVYVHIIMCMYSLFAPSKKCINLGDCRIYCIVCICMRSEEHRFDSISV